MMIRANVGRFGAQANQLSIGHFGPHHQVVLHKQTGFGKVIQNILFVIPFQIVQRSFGHGFFGHDNEFSHGLAVQTIQSVIGIGKTVRAVFQTVAIMAKAVHTANGPHGPQMNLNFTNVLLEFHINDTIPVSTRLGLVIRLERRHFHTTNQGSKRITRQFQHGQKRRKILHHQQGPTKVRHLEDIPIVLLFRLAEGGRHFLDGSHSHFFHAQAARQGFANFHERRHDGRGLVDQILCHLRTRHGGVFLQVGLNNFLVGIFVSVIAIVGQTRHGVEVGIDRIQLHPTKDFVVLVSIAQERTNHAIKVPGILDHGPTLGNGFQRFVFFVILRRSGRGLFDRIVYTTGSAHALFGTGQGSGTNELVGVIGQVEVLFFNGIQFAFALVGLGPMAVAGLSQNTSRLVVRQSGGTTILFLVFLIALGQHELNGFQPRNGRALFAGRQRHGPTLRIGQHETPSTGVTRRLRTGNLHVFHQFVEIGLGVGRRSQRQRTIGRVELINQHAFRNALVPFLFPLRAFAFLPGTRLEVLVFLTGLGGGAFGILIVLQNGR
mmetsp:Transcript_25678/g.60372  ORF Transcript_25678/g.60372 Transcript_25678/m.60372 type:complete len:548 (-) Transcript_25678:638-2281(-)